MTPNGMRKNTYLPDGVGKADLCISSAATCSCQKANVMSATVIKRAPPTASKHESMLGRVQLSSNQVRVGVLMIVDAKRM